MEIKIIIPEDHEEFDKEERFALFIAFRTICDNLGVDGVKCTCNTLE